MSEALSRAGSAMASQGRHSVDAVAARHVQAGVTTFELPEVDKCLAGSDPERVKQARKRPRCRAWTAAADSYKGYYRSRGTFGKAALVVAQVLLPLIGTVVVGVMALLRDRATNRTGNGGPDSDSSGFHAEATRRQFPLDSSFNDPGFLTPLRSPGRVVDSKGELLGNFYTSSPAPEITPASENPRGTEHNPPGVSGFSSENSAS